jgi:hypothetical protein
MKKEIRLKEFQEMLKAQGVPREDMAFVCPICGTIQSARDLIAAGAGKTFEDVEKFVAFSCVGRWTKIGQHKLDREPGWGCDWTLGGLLKCHAVDVVTPDGGIYPRFEPATPEQAKKHLSEPIKLPPKK